MVAAALSVQEVPPKFHLNRGQQIEGLYFTAPMSTADYRRIAVELKAVGWEQTDPGGTPTRVCACCDGYCHNISWSNPSVRNCMRSFVFCLDCDRVVEDRWLGEGDKLPTDQAYYRTNPLHYANPRQLASERGVKRPRK